MSKVHTQNHMPHAKQIWFWFRPPWFCYRCFFRESGFLSFDRLLVPFMVCGFSLPSWLVSLAAWEPEVLGLLGCGSLRTGSRGWPSPGILSLKISPGAPVPWQVATEPLFPSWSQAPQLGATLSFCVSYVMPLRTILETSRPACDWSSCSLNFPRFPCCLLSSLLAGNIFFLINEFPGQNFPSHMNFSLSQHLISTPFCFLIFVVLHKAENF